MLMSCTAALCLLLLPLLPLVLHRPDLIPHILFPDTDCFVALALDHPILPLPPEFQHPGSSNRLSCAAPPPPPSPADSFGRKLIAIGDRHPLSPPLLTLDGNQAPPSNPPPPPPLVLDGNKAPASNPPPPPPPSPLILDCNKAPPSNPPPPSPADSLGRKLTAIGDRHPPSPPSLILDGNKAPPSSPPPPSPLILDCNKAPPSNPPPPPPPPSPLILDCNKAPPSNPPPPPSPADSLGRKFIAIGDCHPPSPPPLILDGNKAPPSNPPLLLLRLFLNSSQRLIMLGDASRMVHWALGPKIVIKPSRSLVVPDCERGYSKNYLEIFCEFLLLIW